MDNVSILYIFKFSKGKHGLLSNIIVLCCGSNTFFSAKFLCTIKNQSICGITVFSPSTFCISTMIPILSILFSKIFNHCIISCEDAALKSDNLQFTYKSGMSTI